MHDQLSPLITDDSTSIPRNEGRTGANRREQREQREPRWKDGEIEEKGLTESGVSIATGKLVDDVGVVDVWAIIPGICEAVVALADDLIKAALLLFSSGGGRGKGKGGPYQEGEGSGERGHFDRMYGGLGEYNSGRGRGSGGRERERARDCKERRGLTSDGDGFKQQRATTATTATTTATNDDGEEEEARKGALAGRGRRSMPRVGFKIGRLKQRLGIVS